MSKIQLYLIALLVVASLGIVPGSVTADDEYPEWGECDEAPVVSSGTYSGQIDSPDDVDSIAFDLKKGEYVSFMIEVSEKEEDFGVEIMSGTVGQKESITDVRNAEYVVEEHPGVGKFITEVDGGIPAYWKLWGEEESETRYCIAIDAAPMRGQSVGDVPYGWELTVEKNGEISTPTPTATPTSTLTAEPTPTPTVGGGGSGDSGPSGPPGPPGSTETGSPTPTPTLTSTPTPTRTATATESPDAASRSPTDDGGDSGDDIQDSDGDGVIDSEDYAPRDPEVQEESDLRNTSGGSGPGLGVGAAVLALLVVTAVALRRS